MLNLRKNLYVMICIVLLFGITACSQPTAGSEGIYTPGTYSATRMGFLGDIKVTIEVDNEKIVSVDIVGEDEVIGDIAIEELPAVIKNANSADVDVIAGATESSNAIIKAAKQCLAQAKGEDITDIEEAEKEYEPKEHTQVNSEKELMKKVGASLTAKEVQYDMSANLNKTFLITGTAELSDYYNWGFDNLEPDYFCIEVQPIDGKYSDSWYIYCHRESFKELFNDLLNDDVGIIAIGAEIPNYLYDKNQGNMAIAKTISW